MIINHDFAKQHKLTLRTLRSPLPVKNVDGSMNRTGPIHSTTIQTVRIQNDQNEFHQERSEFYVTTIGTHDLILSTDWLKAHNPELDWSTSCITFIRCPSSCSQSSHPLIIQPPPSKEPSVFISSVDPAPAPAISRIYQQCAAHLFLVQHELLKYLPPPISIAAKTTHSTTLRNEAPSSRPSSKSQLSSRNTASFFQNPPLIAYHSINRETMPSTSNLTLS